MNSKILFIGLIILLLFFIYQYYIISKKFKSVSTELKTLQQQYNLIKDNSYNNHIPVSNTSCEISNEYQNINTILNQPNVSHANNIIPIEYSESNYSVKLSDDDDMMHNILASSYTTNINADTKKIFLDLNLIQNNTYSESNMTFTELINNDSNPIIVPFVSCILNNIAKQSDNIIVELDESSNDNALDDTIIIKLDGPSNDINTNNLDGQSNDNSTNNLDGPSNEDVDTQILSEKNKELYNKYKKLKLEELRLRCIEKNINLSLNKKQKKKSELIKELILLQ